MLCYLSTTTNAFISQCHGMGEHYSFPALRKTKVQADEVSIPQPPRLSGWGKEPNPAHSETLSLKPNL